MLSKFISLLIFLLLIPLFLVVAIVIFLDDGLPIFFKQKRVGKNKVFFNIFKFRTMKKDTADIATHLIKNQNDQILKSGHFLRKYSIDELPQLFNILLGHINFIGPRPSLFNQYDLVEMRDKYGINEIKPGITGWAQVNGRDSLSLQDKVMLDKYYIENKNVFLNIKIIYKTILKVISAKDIKN
tara:strand:+ start:31638 stop:32189 length:552 start_codon:yes stop_codon:yes gene_type:complete